MKIIAKIDKRSGKVTMSVDGVVGQSCTDITKKLEEGLGMNQPEREFLSEYYEQEVKQEQKQST